ncbi:MAG: YdiK family protein [Bacillaceae bacterium]|uniref:YdiK family protein n=1 Tax=Alkalihalobacterium chitinilyticum TaxID=2980103 RepID=A0ABT5VL71_9BACI|nr:YdiK family protein [Alkalihalobacterium chitinilyticum]MDE5416201.1 YdiK family protein [Alkalihalobacterium chitinilyticum]MEB1808951.1 YdiK family protein [Bacillaceae bacterium]
MRTSPTFMAVVYALIGVMFTYLAIQNVQVAGWNFWTYLFIGLAAVDFMMAYRFFQMRKYIRKSK